MSIRTLVLFVVVVFGFVFLFCFIIIIFFGSKTLTKTNMGRKGFIWLIVCSTLLREAIEETQVLQTKTVGNLQVWTYSQLHPQKTCPVVAPPLLMLKIMPTGCLRGNP